MVKGWSHVLMIGRCLHFALACWIGKHTNLILSVSNRNPVKLEQHLVPKGSGACCWRWQNSPWPRIGKASATDVLLFCPSQTVSFLMFFSVYLTTDCGGVCSISSIQTGPSVQYASEGQKFRYIWSDAFSLGFASCYTKYHEITRGIVWRASCSLSQFYGYILTTRVLVLSHHDLRSALFCPWCLHLLHGVIICIAWRAVSALLRRYLFCRWHCFCYCSVSMCFLSLWFPLVSFPCGVFVSALDFSPGGVLPSMAPDA